MREQQNGVFWDDQDFDFGDEIKRNRQ